MHANSDLIDLLRALNGAGAKYLIVGGYAFAIHGRTRATKDVDIFIGTDAENAARVWDALGVFGAPLDELRVEDLVVPETVFIMGRPPNQIDIITTIDGVAFNEAWANRVGSTYGACPSAISAVTSSFAKEAPGRPQDRADVAYLKSHSNA